MLSIDESVSIDRLEQESIACERLIGRLRAHQLGLLRRLDEAQVMQLDGSRSMVDWTAARLDVSRDTARTLIQAVKLTAECPEDLEQLSVGDVSFDRAIATARLRTTGADAMTIDDSSGFDVAGVHRLAARRRRLSPTDEKAAFLDRHLVTQTSLDGREGRGWFRLPGFELSILEKAIDERADQFRDLPGPSSPAQARRADALVSIAQDTLDPAHSGQTRHNSRDPLVTVLVDATLAADTRGEAGSEVEFGPKVGPATLERILCGGRVQLVGIDRGRPVVTSDATHGIPPAVRRYVIWRDGACTIDGCSSRYRLEPHHVRRRHHGGDHDQDNLATLCWYHHHVKIHGEGYTLDPATPPQRRRLRPPPRGADPPLR